MHRTVPADLFCVDLLRFKFGFETETSGFLVTFNVGVGFTQPSLIFLVTSRYIWTNDGVHGCPAAKLVHLSPVLFDVPRGPCHRAFAAHQEKKPCVRVDLCQMSEVRDELSKLT